MTIHDAAPAARASVDSVAPQPTTDADRGRTDKADSRPVDGTGDPVAWAALLDDGEIAWIGYTPEGAADGACGRRIVTLYRAPTLTEAERTLLVRLAAGSDNPRAWTNRAITAADRATLRGLLERMGGGA